MLNYYYDLNQAGRFEELFGETWIGENPTGAQNAYMILYLNFSSVEVGSKVQELEQNFRLICNSRLSALVRQYAPCLAALPELERSAPVSNNMKQRSKFKAMPRGYARSFPAPISNVM